MRVCACQAQYIFLHQSTLELLNNKGNSQSIWFVSYSALEKMDSLDAMEGNWQHTVWTETHTPIKFTFSTALCSLPTSVLVFRWCWAGMGRDHYVKTNGGTRLPGGRMLLCHWNSDCGLETSPSCRVRRRTNRKRAASQRSLCSKSEVNGLSVT